MKKSIEPCAHMTAGGTVPCREPMTVSEIIRELTAWLGSMIDNIALSLERSRQRRHLYQLNSHMLKDIGLSRADVDFEFRKLPWHD